MPKKEEIFHYEAEKQSNEVVLFLEGKFWKAYEKSAYVLTMLYGLSLKRFALLCEQMVDIETQLNKWKQYNFKQD